MMQRDDVVTGGDCDGGGMRSDKSRRTGDQHPHPVLRSLLPIRGARFAPAPHSHIRNDTAS